MSVPVQAYHGIGVGHITYILGNRRAYRYDCLPALPPLLEGRRPDITPVTESGEVGVHRSLYVNTPEPLGLMVRSFGAREHGVVDVSVAGEQGVVEAFLHGGGLYA